MNVLPDILKPKLKILFIGFNPSLRSAELGHHFAGKSNRFWQVLYFAGLTPRILTYQEDHELLTYGYGLTNIVARPTKTAAEISKEEYQQGRIILLDKIICIKPEIACFVGAGVYQAFTGHAKTTWGFQAEPIVRGCTAFVGPSTSGLVRMTLKEQVSIYNYLAKK